MNNYNQYYSAEGNPPFEGHSTNYNFNNTYYNNETLAYNQQNPPQERIPQQPTNQFPASNYRSNIRQYKPQPQLFNGYAGNPNFNFQPQPYQYDQQQQNSFDSRQLRMPQDNQYMNYTGRSWPAAPANGVMEAPLIKGEMEDIGSSSVSLVPVAHENSPMSFSDNSTSSFSALASPTYNAIDVPLKKYQAFPIKTRPKLIRTATLPKDKNAGSRSYKKYKKEESSPSESPTSPEGGYTNVQVTLVQPLDLALKNWLPGEIMNKRRLLLFDWRLNGASLEILFTPIFQKDYVPNSPVISCIYWDYHNEYYVTSVDVIFLLEQLSGSESFDIKEKNRIRRNLQTLESLTIGKTFVLPDDTEKVSSQSGRHFIKHTVNPVEMNKIFELIMKYNSPKPRHIEKDIKIYKWSLLHQALLRVLTKYCHKD